MLTDALRSELIKLRALRTTYALGPVSVLAMAGTAVLWLDGARREAGAGAAPSAIIESAAFAFGSGTLVSGVALAVFTALLVTTDLSSGSINHSLLLLTRGRVFGAKLLLALGAAMAVSLVGTLAVGLVAAVMLPGTLLGALTTSGTWWLNLLGLTASHLLWACLGSTAGMVVKRQAPAVGVLLAVTLAVPVASATVAAIGGPTRWAEYLPSGLMQAATVTGSESMLSLSPGIASLGLLAWVVAVAAVGWLSFRRTA